MANKNINKTLTRGLVTLGTICAGAVIWGSVSGQFQATPLAAQENTAPVLADTASGVLQTPPVATVPVPTVGALPATQAAASQPVVTAPPATTAAKPAVTVAPPATVKTVPKLKTRGS